MHAYLLLKTEIFYIPLFMNITSYNLRYHVHLRNLYQKHVIGLRKYVYNNKTDKSSHWYLSFLKKNQQTLPYNEAS